MTAAILTTLLLPALWPTGGNTLVEHETIQSRTVYIHVDNFRSNYVVVAQTMPAPEAIFSVVGDAPQEGANLTCTEANGIFFCDQGVALQFQGCYAPEGLPQGPTIPVSWTPRR